MSFRLKILSKPAMNERGEKISPCSTPLSMLNEGIQLYGCLMQTDIYDLF